MTRFLVLLLAYILSQFFRSFLAVVAPELAHDLGLSPADLGTMSAVWFWCFALAQLFVGWSLDRIGPRWTVSALMLLAVAGSLLLASAQSLAGCVLGMALIGLGCSPIYMGSLFLFGRDAGKDRFALLSSLMLGFGSAGNLLGTTPLALASATYGWRPTLAAIGVLTAVSAGLVALLIRDPAKVQPQTGDAGPVRGLLRILAIRDLWPFLPITLFSYAVLLAERGLWVGPFFADVHGLGPVDRGNAVLGMAAAMSAGAFAYGATDRLGSNRKWVVASGSFATAALFLLLAAVGDRSVLLAAVLLALIGAAGMTYVQLIAHARLFIPDALLGRGISTMNLLYFGGAGLLQPLSGLAVNALKIAGVAPSPIYAALHACFGLLLLVSTAVYALTKQRPGQPGNTRPA